MKYVAAIIALFAISLSARAQKPESVVPITAEDLRHLCQSFELVRLKSDLHKPMSSDELANAYACLNYIMGVLGAIGAMDVGVFPKLRYEIATSGKPIPYKDYVASLMTCLDDHPEYQKEPAAAVVALALMEARILVPKTWNDSKPGKPSTDNASIVERKLRN